MNHFELCIFCCCRFYVVFKCLYKKLTRFCKWCDDMFSIIFKIIQFNHHFQVFSLFRFLLRLLYIQCVDCIHTHTHAQPPINPSTRTQTNTFLMWVVLLCLCFGIGSSEMLLLFVVVIVACRQPLYTKFSSIYLTWITLKCVLLIQWQITQSAQAIDYIDNSIIQQKNHIPNVLSSIFFFSSQFLCVILLYVI